MPSVWEIRTGGILKPIEKVKQEISAMNSPSVLEIGTKRWTTGKSTHHKAAYPNAGVIVFGDVENGEDVDIVCDAHSLSKTFGENAFDVFWASSVWEHLERPWIAAKEVERILKPGGVFFIQTHQSFPLHGYPKDFFRFSQEALRVLFDWATDIHTTYDYPCKIKPPANVPWNDLAESFLNVSIYGKKK